VMITFGVYIFLNIFYIFFYLYPSIQGDFYGLVGVPNMWHTDDEKQTHA